MSATDLKKVGTGCKKKAGKARGTTVKRNSWRNTLQVIRTTGLRFFYMLRHKKILKRQSLQVVEQF